MTKQIIYTILDALIFTLPALILARLGVGAGILFMLRSFFFFHSKPVKVEKILEIPAGKAKLILILKTWAAIAAFRVAIIIISNHFNLERLFLILSSIMSLIIGTIYCRSALQSFNEKIHDQTNPIHFYTDHPYIVDGGSTQSSSHSRHDPTDHLRAGLYENNPATDQQNKSTENSDDGRTRP